MALRDTGEVLAMQLAPVGAELTMRARVPVADEPVALALTPDEQMLLVTSGWGHALTELRAKDLGRVHEWGLPREPRGVVTSMDGATAWVAHLVGDAISVVHLADPDRAPDWLDGVVLLPTEARERAVPRRSTQGVAIVRVATMVVVPTVLVNSGERGGSTRGYGSGGPVPAMASAFRFASPEQGYATNEIWRDARCLLPRAVAFDPRRQGLLLGCDGEQHLKVVGPWKFWGGNEACDESGSTTQRACVPAAEYPALGPIDGIALDRREDRAVVWSQEAQKLQVVDLARPAPASPDADFAGLSPNPIDAELQRGRALFHRPFDERISKDGRACASCHPDGRDDGLVWSTPDGPRQTPMLAGRLSGTSPFGWSGRMKSLREHVGQTLSRLEGKGLPDADMQALLRYVASMTPPARRVAKESERIAFGRQIFESADAGCATCHISGDTFTDNAPHDVGSFMKGDRTADFDTPSLLFVGGTAPYFHDGRYKTLEHLLEDCDSPSGTHMGKTSHLSAKEKDALKAYLETL